MRGRIKLVREQLLLRALCYDAVEFRNQLLFQFVVILVQCQVHRILSLVLCLQALVVVLGDSLVNIPRHFHDDGLQLLVTA